MLVLLMMISAFLSKESCRALVMTNVDKPEIKIIPDTMVTEGNTGTLQCHVTSKTRPFIQWFKKVDDTLYNPPTDLTFDLNGQLFTVLKPGQMEEGPGNVYSSPLVLESVTEADEGLYACLASNRFGMSQQFTNLYITSVLSTTPTP
uniref:Ig-like domain-containing protein n=2 Tax=Magallana gigas TaxID=29159 RepID=A0A8W8IZC0_MAGGI|nr:vascular endothelial growth factor receptor 1 isoform X1 [Crassostrea gigas]